MKKILIVILLVVVGYLVYTYTQTPHDMHYEGDGHDHQTENMQKVNTSTASTSQKVSLVGEKQIDTTKSTFNWTGQKAVLKNWIDKGTVRAQSGKVVFEDGSIKMAEVVIDMNSITSSQTGSGGGQEKLTTHLKSADFFDTQKFSTAKLVVTSITDTTAKGLLTIKDVTKEVTFPVSVKEADGQVMISGKLTVDRSLFGVKFGSNSFFDNLGERAIDNIFTIDFNVITK